MREGNFLSGLFGLKKKKPNESDDRQRQRESVCTSVLPSLKDTTLVVCYVIIRLCG